MTEYPQTKSLPTSSAQNKPSVSQEQSRWLAETIARAADDRKGGDIVLLHVADISYLAEYFVLVTGFSRVQVRAIAEAIKQTAAEECAREPLRQEGQNSGSWLVQDYGDVIVHIFMPKERDYYNLEAFWSHAERIPFVPGAIAP
jgi:ribosome-associated protein